MPKRDADAEHETVTVSEVYLHISNGGVTIAVRDSGFGPEVVMESSHFGNNVSSQRVMVEPRVLERLRDVFTQAADHARAGGFSETYCHAADYRDPHEFTGAAGCEGDAGDEDDESDTTGAAGPEGALPAPKCG